MMTRPPLLPRAWLALAAALLAAVALAPGCATGGSTDTTSGSGDDGGALESGVADGPVSTTCGAPKTMCGTACVNENTDPNNCGSCGKVCSAPLMCANGVCAYSCPASQTICGVPVDGGVDASVDSDATDDAGAGSDAGENDAASSSDADAAPLDAASLPVDAGGPMAPYCANLGVDPANCGTCGNTCKADHLCTNGSCTLNCAAGTKPCASSDVCIPMNTCCASSDCPISGEICASPGSSCACALGQHACAATSSCIVDGGCCTAADCTIPGELCMPGGTCGCPAGQHGCSVTNSCIPLTQCCTPTDCPPPSEVMATTCTGGACGIGACDPGYLNFNGSYTDGCECHDNPYARTCAAAGNVATLGVPGSGSASGTLPVAGEEAWFQVALTSKNCSAHPVLTLSTNPNNEFLFDVYTNCSGTAVACSGEGGSCTGKTTWETQYTNTNPACNAASPAFQGIPAVVWVRVYRATGAPTCDAWTLTMTD